MISSGVRSLISPMIFATLGSSSDLLFSMNFQYPTLPAGLTFSRASAATDIIDGVLTSFASGVPRVSVANGYLSEPQATNIAFYASGSFTYGGTESNAQSDPLGTSKAFIFTEDTNTSSHGRILNNKTPSGSTVYSVSIFLKAGTCNRVQLTASSGHAATNVYANFYLNGSGSVSAAGAGATGAFITELVNGWYRVGFTFTTVASPSSTGVLRVYSLVTGSENRAPTFVGTSRTFFSAMGQFEDGPCVTSYIPAQSSDTTRAADQLSLTDPTLVPFVYGRVVVEAKTSPYDKTTSPSQTILVMANASENILFRKDITTLKMKATSTGLTNAVDVADEVLGAVGVNTDITQDLRWSPDGWFMNTSSDLTSDSFSAPFTSVSIGNGASAGDNWGGYIKSLKVYGYTP